MKLLIGSPGACNPLWLSLSCEELRVFGVFETVTRHIRTLPATLKDLLQFIINRLTNEDQENNIYKVFYIWLDPSAGSISVGGLSSPRLLAGSFPVQRMVLELITSIVNWSHRETSCCLTTSLIKKTNKFRPSLESYTAEQGAYMAFFSALMPPWSPPNIDFFVTQIPIRFSSRRF